MNVLPDPFSSFSGVLRAALGDSLAPEAATFLDMVADDIVMEFPYAPAGALTEVKGKVALANYLPGLASIITIETMALTAVHRVTEAGVFVLEFSCTGHGTQTGIAYDQRYISVVTTEHGRITHYRDYWNPLIALRATGGDDAISAALKDGSSAA